MAPHKVIFDTDPGVDDVLALLLLLASPEIQLEAITVTFGNTDLDYAYTNILKVYALISDHLAKHPHDIARFPNFSRPGQTTLFAKGRKGPIEGELRLAAYFHGQDGLSNISETHPHFSAPESHSSLTAVTEEAYKVILTVLDREPPGTVTLLAAGPLTNVALALRESPQTFRKAKRVVIMGGALDVPGNTSPVAEFNFFADPYAALEVTTARDLPVVLLPLDITVPHSVAFDILLPTYHDLTPDHTPLQNFITAILTRPRDVMRMLGEIDAFQMHDPLAAWFVIKHAHIQGYELASGWATEKRRFLVERTGELTKGMCVVDRRGTKEAAGSVRAEDGGIEEAIALKRRIGAHGEGGVDVVVETSGLQDLADALMDRVIRKLEGL